MIDVIAQALPLAVVASTPLLLAVEGETVVERSGIINLGIEGMMLTAAMTAVVAAQVTGSATMGFAGGIAGALLIGAIFGVFVIALGLTGFAWRELERRPLFMRNVPHIAHDAIVPLAWIVIPIALALMLWNTSFGLRLRACGENPEAVLAAGASVDAHRWAAIAIESVLAGIGGAYLALALSSGFAENMTAGRGFIALSIVIFGRWKLKGALLGTAVFGAAAAIQYALQATSRGVPFHLLLALPYVVTLLILCGIAGRVRAPESLGK